MFPITVLLISLQILTLVSRSYQECYRIETPEHARMQYYYNAYQVACDPGYILHGKPVVYCLDNEWESSPPSCIASTSACMKPPAPEYGTIECDEEPLTIGKACKFECNDGYELQGTNGRRCMANGQWSGLNTTCIQVSGTQCELPKPLKHGTVIGCTTAKLPRVSEKCSFRCNAGYTIKGPTSLTCRSTGIYTDENGNENFPECVETLDPCPSLNCEQICVRKENRCGCIKGFILNKENRRTCDRHYGPPVHPLPCDFNNGGCDHICKNTQHGARCSCNPGFRRTGNGLKRCTPYSTRGTNKPTYQSSPCRNNRGGGCDHYCSVSSLTGEIFCSCEKGYERGGKDMKQCIKNSYTLYYTEPQPHVTSAPATCEVNKGGCDHFCDITENAVQCSCQDGYRLHSDGKRCLDINECLSKDLNNCQHNCKNTRGSYSCSCNRGFKLIDGYKCEDVDECLREETNNCNHYCHNTEGSFTCSCRPGFTLMDGHRCEGCGKNSYWSFNLNGCVECPKNSHTDSEGATSVLNCVCDPGFAGYVRHDATCEDIDECLTDNFGCSHDCLNVPGSAYCNCPAGFKLDSDNKTCIDIDECSIKNGGCEGTCHNLHGSFRCSCPEGYASSNKDEYSCQDVDECLDNNGGCEQKCINYAGGYYCACKDGYRLNSGLKNCSVIQCPALPVPPHSNMTCRRNGKKIGEMEYYLHGTKCNFTCNRGFKHASNSKIMKCQNDGSWSGTLPKCRAQNCNPLRVPENGVVHPSICSTQGVEVKQRCAFSCNPGYKLEGHPVLTCKNNLTWTYEVPVCLGNVKPRIECPPDITIPLNPGNSTHSITLQEPITNVENYKVQPEWVSAGVSIEFPAGVTRVTFTAASPNSNKTARCVTTITILDEEPPVFEYCPEPIEIEDAEAEGAFVSWEEPVVTDNVELESVFSISEPNKTFAPGTYVVEYIARDISGNIASCSFNISITRMHCSKLDDPPHGNANCVHWMYGILCEPQCEDGYMRNPDDPVYYSCDDSGVWEPTDAISECLKFIPLTTYDCPDGFMLKANNETAEEVCVECPSNKFWSAATKKCEEK